ncbi:MAG: Ribulose-phosphate 3-epimerase [uncultured Acidimicrobiales bacterium]|uniref:Ribulose-phosphate 3-epimerase n=1 Tax=uncultured Acidimicrobiales bacterium TaxID=310071 RepID=A0A6J4I1K7_9ACTN|nr:MAG: Ribulose-phosphate 3-epimerase [uncultured Acidimicrobiales bacterium]
MRLAPSILAADFAALGTAVEGVSAVADLLHVDVMDGHFVPNISLGPPVVTSLRKHTDLYLDCHLMISDPAAYLPAFAEAGANGCSVHVEIGRTGELIGQMRELGIDAGLAVNPDTPFDAFAEYLDQIDLLLLMTVFPGFGGQAFMPEVLPKIRRVADEVERRGLPVAIQVDGGIDERTVQDVAGAGATVFVAGSAVFGATDPVAAGRRIREAAIAAGPPRP